MYDVFVRLANYSSPDQPVPSLGLVMEGRVVALSRVWNSARFTSVDELLANAPGALREITDRIASSRLDLGDCPLVSEVRLLPTVLRPPRIFALAANFRDHVREGGVEPEPKAGRMPLVFSKLPSSLIGDGDSIVLPDDSSTVDWEVELAAVIGTEGRRITQSDAMSHVAGYSVFNDLSARSMEFPERTQPADASTDWFDFLNGKWFDTSASLGPWLTTADEIDDPLNLRMYLDVNGRRWQDSTTGEMIFDISECVSFISRWTKLLPGDVIVLGTPAGCGFPTGTYLQPGDAVHAEIEGLGVLRNSVVGAQL